MVGDAPPLNPLTLLSAEKLAETIIAASKKGAAAAAFGGVPLSAASLKVLAAASCISTLEIFDPEGKLVYATAAYTPRFGASGDGDDMTAASKEPGFLYAERRALAEIGTLEQLASLLNKGYTLRYTSSDEWWEELYCTLFRKLQAICKAKGALLSLVTGGPSDPDQITHAAHVAAMKGTGGDASTRIIRVEAHPYGPDSGRIDVLVEGGKCHLGTLSRERDPHSFGNAKGLTGLMRDVQEAALKHGLHTNCLRVSLLLMTAAIEDLAERFPKLLPVFYGRATEADIAALRASMPKWEKTKLGPSGAVYAIITAPFPRVTVAAMSTELNASKFGGVTGIVAQRKQLSAASVTTPLMPVVIVNSGESTHEYRPGQHINNQRKGNPLPRAAFVAARTVGGAGAASMGDAFCPWSSDGFEGTVGAASTARMTYEIALGLLLCTQQAAAASWHAACGHTSEVLVLGTNFISCGPSAGDPLRKASGLQAGAQGLESLRILFRNAANADAVNFLIARLEILGYTRISVLQMTAKAAYAVYCSSNGAAGGVNDPRVLAAAAVLKAAVGLKAIAAAHKGVAAAEKARKATSDGKAAGGEWRGGACCQRPVAVAGRGYRGPPWPACLGVRPGCSGCCCCCAATHSLRPPSHLQARSPATRSARLR